MATTKRAAKKAAPPAPQQVRFPEPGEDVKRQLFNLLAHGGDLSQYALDRDGRTLAVALLLAKYTDNQGYFVTRLAEVLGTLNVSSVAYRTKELRDCGLVVGKGPNARLVLPDWGHALIREVGQKSGLAEVTPPVPVNIERQTEQALDMVVARQTAETDEASQLIRRLGLDGAEAVASRTLELTDAIRRRLRESES